MAAITFSNLLKSLHVCCFLFHYVATAPLPLSLPNGTSRGSPVSAGTVNLSHPQWAGEGYSSTTMSDCDRKSPRPVLHVSDVQTVIDRKSPPYGILRKSKLVF